MNPKRGDEDESEYDEDEEILPFSESDLYFHNVEKFVKLPDFLKNRIEKEYIRYYNEVLDHKFIKTLI